MKCTPSGAPKTKESYNVHHLQIPVFIIDMVKKYQDDPQYATGITECTLVEMLSQQPFACGDLETQIRAAVIELTSKGFLRYMGNGYRTLGMYAELANASNKRQYNRAWDKIEAMLNIGRHRLTPSTSSECTTTTTSSSSSNTNSNSNRCGTRSKKNC